jgi:hypothetical protein
LYLRDAVADTVGFFHAELEGLTFGGVHDRFRGTGEGEREGEFNQKSLLILIPAHRYSAGFSYRTHSTSLSLHTLVCGDGAHTEDALFLSGIFFTWSLVISHISRKYFSQ